MEDDELLSDVVSPASGFIVVASAIYYSCKTKAHFAIFNIYIKKLGRCHAHVIAHGLARKQRLPIEIG